MALGEAPCTACNGTGLAATPAPASPAPTLDKDALDRWGATHKPPEEWYTDKHDDAPASPAPPTDVFQALRDAGGSDWDKIEDPQAFLDELRGEVPASPAVCPDCVNGAIVEQVEPGHWEPELCETCNGTGEIVAPASPAAGERFDVEHFCRELLTVGGDLVYAHEEVGGLSESSLEAARDELVVGYAARLAALERERDDYRGALMLADGWLGEDTPPHVRDAVRAALAKGGT